MRMLGDRTDCMGAYWASWWQRDLGYFVFGGRNPRTRKEGGGVQWLSPTAVIAPSAACGSASECSAAPLVRAIVHAHSQCKGKMRYVVRLR